MKYQIYVDTGGTFTDCIGIDSRGEVIRKKVLSNGSLRAEICKVGPGNRLEISENWGLSRDIFRGYSFRILQEEFVRGSILAFDPVSRSLDIAPQGMIREEHLGKSIVLFSGEEAPVLGARLITQTPLREALPPLIMKLGSTRGTNALLEGKGAPTVMLVTEGFRDLLEIGTQQRPDIFALKVRKKKALASHILEIRERIDAEGRVLRTLDEEDIIEKLEKLPGSAIFSYGISLMNSCKNPVHEQQIRALLDRRQMQDVSVSTELSSLIRYFHRTETTLVNAYLSPVIREYLEKVSRLIGPDHLQVMSSAGGLMGAGLFRPKDSLLSGPAGGVVGASLVSRQAGYDHIISFDMGGTSTDVSRYDQRFEYRYELEIGDAHIFSPAIAIETVAAGGGSICTFDGFRLLVGPESAGAFPGPACYGAGGPLTITDVHLLLGRLDPSQFGIPVYPEKSEERFAELLQLMEKKTGSRPTGEEVLRGFLDIANEIMAGAIRKISVSKGYDPADYVLTAFGGAGGLHACAMAFLLGINRILIPADAGLLSAYGLGNAVQERFEERQVLQPFENARSSLDEWYARLAEQAVHALTKEGVPRKEIVLRQKLIFLRFTGQDSHIELEYHTDKQVLEEFRTRYESIYGHWPEDRKVEVESVRVIVSGKTAELQPCVYPAELHTPEPAHFIQSFTPEGWMDVPVFIRRELEPGARIAGMAILLDPYSTTVIEPGWELVIDPEKAAHLHRVSVRETLDQTRSGPRTQAIELELFTNRFMSLAEEMGAMLQRTSLSVNVKERLDFSCALVDPKGYLVANAPHIPVHLGSLGVCVRKVLQVASLQPGDTLITNHPAFGGSHLPDITLITPVFTPDRTLVAFVVNRSHHAEIGGIQPASMPAHARNLEEEGVVIPPMHLVEAGQTRWNRIREVLTVGKYPSRLPEENLADLNAALAANRAGSAALLKMVDRYGLDSVLLNMRRLREHAALKMKETIGNLRPGKYVALEKLDDGTPLKASISLNHDQVLIDFTGSGSLHPGNLNANEAIVNSVVIYVLRLLIGEPIPLNDGILDPVRIILPEGILNPSFPTDPAFCPPVVGGNVETSQRLTDTLLKAFGLIACSQGTMNNLLFGNREFSYYETICGGCGAGPGFHGASAVHHHMTNTRITDPEVLEHRHPVRLHHFEIRNHSGGRGTYNGGDGVIREMEFLRPVKLSLLSQHRIEAPYGIEGGEPGLCGRQWIIRANGSLEMLEGIDEAEMNPGDRVHVETPGGGGYGPV